MINKVTLSQGVLTQNQILILDVVPNSRDDKKQQSKAICYQQWQATALQKLLRRRWSAKACFCKHNNELLDMKLTSFNKFWLINHPIEM